MQKPKRSAKNQSNPNTFISPFPLEECIDRLPAGVGDYIDHDTYDFSIMANINDKRNQTTNLWITLQRTADGQTLVESSAATGVAYYLLAIVVSCLLGVMVALILLNPLGLFVSLPLGGLTFYQAKYQRNILLKSVLALFKPVPKVQQPHRGFLIFPWLGFRLTTILPLDACAVRLQQLTFDLLLVNVVSLNSEEYYFSIRSFAAKRTWVRVSGWLEYEKDYTTRIRYRIFPSSQSFVPIFFVISATTISSIGTKDGIITACIMGAFILISVLISILPEIFSARRILRKILNP